MKKILILCAAIMLLASACKEQEPLKTTTIGEYTNFSQSPMKLNGQVNSLKMLTYWAKDIDGEIVRGEIITRAERDSLGLGSDNTIFFNEAGILTRSEFQRDGGIVNYWETEIEDNRIIKATWFNNGEPRYYWKKIYDENGNNVENLRYRIADDTLMNRAECIYDANGNLIEIQNYNASGNLGNKVVCTWDENGKITELVSTNPSGEYVLVLKIKYDEAGNFSKVTYDRASSGIREYVYKDIKLDEMGNPVYLLISRDDFMGISEFIIEYY